MSRRSLPVLIAGLVCGLLGVGSPAFAQPASEPEGDTPDEGFFDVVEVEIVNIDVWVTDKKGNPVAGLGKDDFAVFRDGQQVEVTNFYAVSDGRPASSTAGTGPVPDAGRTPLGRTPLDRAPEIETPPDHRLWLIVYIDNYNLDPIERNRIFPALRHFLLQSLRPDDRAMLVTYNRSLEVKQPFTADARILADSLVELEDDFGHAIVRRRNMVSTLHLIDRAESAGQALAYARQYAEEQMNGVQYTVDALERLIDTLGGLPGRKALVYVSSGVPMAAGEEAFHAVAERFGISGPYAEIPRHDTSRSFEKVNRRANTHRVTFYTVDAGGLRGLEFGAAEYAGFVNPRLRRTLDSVVSENLQAPLRLMAIGTGGKAIVNQNEILPALESAADDFRSFYSLGIASGDAVAGRYHKVEVKLQPRRKDLRLRHRAGYLSKSLDTRVREKLRSALLYAHQSNPGNVTVTLGRPVPHGNDGNYLLPIQLHIPLRDLVLLPIGDGRHEARLRLFVGAVEGEGGTSEIDTAPFGLRLADEHVEAARKESLLHTHKLLLSPGRRKIGVAILDLFGRESSVVTRYVQIGPLLDTG